MTLIDHMNRVSQGVMSYNFQHDQLRKSVPNTRGVTSFEDMQLLGVYDNSADINAYNDEVSKFGKKSGLSL